MNTDLYGTEYEMPKGEVIELYKKDMRNILTRICPELTLSEIDEAMNWSIAKSYSYAKEHYDLSVKVHNNYKKTLVETDLLSLC